MTKSRARGKLNSSGPDPAKKAWRYRHNGPLDAAAIELEKGRGEGFKENSAFRGIIKIKRREIPPDGPKRSISRLTEQIRLGCVTNQVAYRNLVYHRMLARLSKVATFKRGNGCVARLTFSPAHSSAPILASAYQSAEFDSNVTNACQSISSFWRRELDNLTTVAGANKFKLAAVEAIVFSPDGRLLFTAANRDRVIAVWDTKSCTLERELRLPTSAIAHPRYRTLGIGRLALRPADESEEYLLASAGYDGALYLFPEYGAPVVLRHRSETNDLNMRMATDICWGSGPTRDRLFAGYETRRDPRLGDSGSVLRMWDPITREECNEIFVGPPVSSIALSPAGSLLVCGTTGVSSLPFTDFDDSDDAGDRGPEYGDGKIRVYDVRTSSGLVLSANSHQDDCNLVGF
ncbi:Quino protein amine dehydrogenase, partial [Blyttiomyces helicus]